MNSDNKLTIEKIHNEFMPKYDRWNGKLMPRIISWFAHILEFVVLWFKGDKTYWKHGRTTGTCREHAKIEFGDWLWLTAEIVWMVTKIELPIIPQYAYQRMWDKMEETRAKQDRTNLSD